MSSASPRSPLARAFVNPDEGRLRAGWRVLLGAVAFVATLLVAQIAGFGLEAALVALGATAVPLRFLSQTLWMVLLTGVLVGLAAVVDERTIPDLGLGGPAYWPNLAFGLALGVAMSGAVLAVELATGLVAVDGVAVTRSTGPGGATMPFAAGLALTTLLFLAVGVGEEVFARGYLMTNLAEGLNGLGPIEARSAVAIAGVASSAVFGVLHLGNPNASALSTLNITVVGLFLAWTYVVTDDLGVPIGVHVTWNLSLGALWGFPVSGTTLPASVLDVRSTGDPLLTGGEFGPEGGLIVYLSLAVGIGLTWAWVRWRGGSVRFREDVAVPERQ